MHPSNKKHRSKGKITPWCYISWTEHIAIWCHIVPEDNSTHPDLMPITSLVEALVRITMRVDNIQQRSSER